MCARTDPRGRGASKVGAEPTLEGVGGRWVGRGGEGPLMQKSLHQSKDKIESLLNELRRTSTTELEPTVRVKIL